MLFGLFAARGRGYKKYNAQKLRTRASTKPSHLVTNPLTFIEKKITLKYWI